MPINPFFERLPLQHVAISASFPTESVRKNGCVHGGTCTDFLWYGVTPSLCAFLWRTLCSHKLNGGYRAVRCKGRFQLANTSSGCSSVFGSIRESKQIVQIVSSTVQKPCCQHNHFSTCEYLLQTFASYGSIDVNAHASSRFGYSWLQAYFTEPWKISGFTGGSSLILVKERSPK